MNFRRYVGAMVAAVFLLLQVGAAAAAAPRREEALSPQFEVHPKVVGRRGGRLRVELTLRVASDRVGRTMVGGVEVAQLAVRGEVSRQQVVMETFSYVFTVPVEGEDLPVQIERELRPGEYQLRVELEDLTSRRRAEEVLSLSVEVAADMVASSQYDGPTADQGTTRRILLVPPAGEVLAGLQSFTAVAVGEVARVEFLLDGQLVLTRNRPPFDAVIDLGPLPRTATVTAVARDATDNELDRAQVVINQGRERFVVRLEPITPADRQAGQVRVRAMVRAPSERRVEQVEFYLGDRRIAAVTNPPFEAWLPQPGAGGMARAVATLDDGAQGEDITFLDGGAFVTDVRVDAVELPVTVVGEGGEPLEDLQLADFEVLEDGVPQRLTHLARHAEVPLRVGIVVDTSGSMEKTLPEVQRVALAFLRNLLRPTDRAFVVAFSDRPVLLEPLTRDFEALGRSLLALRAERLTAVYDAIVFSLFQFTGVRGRRALVVLTDGEDNASRHTFDQVIEAAGRTGAVIYAVGVDLSLQHLRARAGLQRLARATGGRAFFVASGGSLERVWKGIERDLRSQYLIAYTSSSSLPPGTWRSVEVRVRRRGVTVRTVSGYLPE